MFVSPQKIRWFFLLKAVVVPPAWIAILIWSFVKVPASQGLFGQHTHLSGSTLSYAWLSALNSALGIYSTLAVNIPDFTVRFRSVCTTLIYLFLLTAVREERASVSSLRDPIPHRLLRRPKSPDNTSSF